MSQITHHTQLLQALIDKYGLKSYLEIGVQDPANNFDKIKCEHKVGVDPELNYLIEPGLVCEEKTDRFEVGDYMNYYELQGMTSDVFFNTEPKPRRSFDLIFIDGLHHADQVKRDFENSLRCLSDNGFIVIHDVLPENEEGTIVPRQTKMWWGDVYKFAMSMVDYRLEFRTYNIDNGCMVVQKNPIGWNGTEFRDLPAPIEPTWENFNLHKQRLLRITDAVEI